ncbi:Hypothetical protein PACV_412 [Pacmanvirus A23]|uniref:Hypothetical protein n=1 Tax=Pacmanvirus A23 TaxID=1932881 RepID=UPI000A0937E1|nr:Hypothetical protein B9W72_gp408 [Pacmanvirus A23]SIP86125.1 Hypothetical protein PACV_412 [Pacmanvirus A23]
MRIIKLDTDNIYKVIAGEMLNIETSTLHYLDGVPLVIGKDITLNEYRGYPKIMDGTVQYTIKAVVGYIFVPTGFDIKLFESNIIDAIKNLENNMIYDGKAVIGLKGYHTAEANFNTNVKVKSALNLTKNGDSVPKMNRWDYNQPKPNNVKRQFITEEGDVRRGRFTWIIQTIDKFDFEINSDNIDDAVSRFACSVFYDADNICKMNHNDTTSDFTITHLKGCDNIITEDITLFKHGNPLAFELSEYWRDRVSNTKASEFLRNIPDNKIYEHEYHALEFKPVKISETSNDTSTEVCSKCRSVLYGDNYAMVGSVKNPESTLCVALCPLCLHSSPEEKPIEMKYFIIFRVKFPRSIEEMIDSNDVSDERKLLRRESLKRIERKECTCNGKNIKYIMIGDKYVAFEKVNDYIFTRLSILQEFAGRKVCTAKLVE